MTTSKLDKKKWKRYENMSTQNMQILAPDDIYHKTKIIRIYIYNFAWLTLGNDSEVIDIFEEIYISACSKV